MEKVTVIVPVYNVELLLEKCIDSILNQTYKNIEVILVDDGSTDSSSTICDKYKEKDDRIKVIHKENGGLSDARNVGMQEMTGDYVCFIDSDDYIEKDMLKLLLEDIKKSNSDISSCGKIIEYTDKTEKKNNTDSFVNTPIEALSRMLTFDNFDNSFCDKMFKVELLKDEKFPVGDYYEDMAVMYRIIQKAHLISHITYEGYHYIIRNNSISNEKFSLKQLDMIKHAKKCRNNIIENYPTIKEQADSFYYLNLINIMLKIKDDKKNSKYKNEFMKFRKEYDKEIARMIRNKYISKEKKIMIILIYFRLYKIVILIKKIKSRI